MNLFASFAANNFLWLIWYHVILDTNVLEAESQVILYIYRNQYKLFMTAVVIMNKIVSVCATNVHKIAKWDSYFMNYKFI